LTLQRATEPLKKADQWHFNADKEPDNHARQSVAVSLIKVFVADAIALE
jgi:hypothetical protein